MKCRDFEKFITNELLQDKDVKKVHVCEVKKDLIERNLCLQKHENILYTWDFCNGIVIVNYCKY